MRTFQFSTGMITAKAKEVAAEAGIRSHLFRASTTWARRFFRCHKLSIRARTRQGQTTPEDAARVAAEFTASVRQTMVEQGISEVYNADQTAVCFEYLPRKTIDHRNAWTVWVRCAGKDKERATAMLLADANGNK
ncbi:hypothetical protein JG688_00017929 [Phytophthora aleatoria]|uniref:HTH CENPB-type domain-containing protein n=1 Tax=Phytophthora aleatoria TaxID=2496075 RepID=A0A8J5IGN9_9STRA|nr:hypothetical protein JG688_00017929 [Phytophthora aleatoria]